MFTYRLALEMKIYDVEAFKKKVSRRQLRKWMAFYHIEPWGQPWLMAGRMTSLLMATWSGWYDKHTEERFLVTYRDGDEYRSKLPRSDAELSAELSGLLGMKDKACRPSEKSGQSSPPPRVASPPA